MNNTCNMDESESLPTGIFELPGEPAIVINGLPPISSTDGNLFPCPVVNAVDSQRNFGEWFEGREVRKLFGEQFYSGKVTEFDKETGWYRVVYEDGDSEDLEWDELVEVLQPLDITVPLKTLAMKIIKKKQKSGQKSRKSGARSHDASNAGGKGKKNGNA